MNNSRIFTIKNAKFSEYYVYRNLNIWEDFQICISVPLSCVTPICRRIFKASESGEKRDGHRPDGNYMFKVKNSNTRTRCEICSKLTMKKNKRRLA